MPAPLARAMTPVTQLASRGDPPWLRRSGTRRPGRPSVSTMLTTCSVSLFTRCTRATASERDRAHLVGEPLRLRTRQEGEALAGAAGSSTPRNSSTVSAAGRPAADQVALVRTSAAGASAMS